MKIEKRTIIIITAIIIAIFIAVILIINSNKKYDINEKISNYDLNSNYDDYVEYIKGFIFPEKLRKFVYNDYITFDQYKDTATGHIIKNQMEFKAYELLFDSMFNKERKSFDDCPVTENFKEKFNTNLLEYFNLIESDDCKSISSLYIEDKEVVAEVYGNFKNIEPTYWTTHHFHYTLDDEGNVDDVVFDYTEK